MLANEQAGDVFGSYELERCVGEGSMGRVWLARHVKLGRQAAIKILKPEAVCNNELVGRFFDEARVANAINHEHIVAVADFVEERDPQRVYCVMEYLTGESLGRRMSLAPVSLHDSLSVMAQVCEALAAAHRVGVVHRDIKPDNIFVTPKMDGSLFAKVLDFGVAKLSAKMKRDVNATQTGRIIGTPLYMAPEQFQGVPVGSAADVYGVGVVLYELLAGRAPFDDDNLCRLGVMVMQQAPPALPKRNLRGERIPSALISVVMRALNKDPARRPPIDAMIDVLNGRAAPLPKRRLVACLAATVGAACIGMLLLAMRAPPVHGVPPPPLLQTVALSTVPSSDARNVEAPLAIAAPAVAPAHSLKSTKKRELSDVGTLDPFAP